jgi:hypothetical protein
MLKGNKVDLELVDKEDLEVLRDWDNDVDFVGEYEPFSQSTLSALQKQFDEKGESDWWFVRRKDGTPVGYVAHWKAAGAVGSLAFMDVAGSPGSTPSHGPAQEARLNAITISAISGLFPIISPPRDVSS